MHANYFINKGKGTCKDFVALMNKVRARVKKHSGIKLEAEVRVIGEK